MTIALVTGGSRGLGRNAAIHLARKGVDVILTYHSNEAAAREAVAAVEAEGARGAALRLDAADVASFPAFVDAVREALRGMGAERLDILYNNAGTGAHASFAETTEAQFDQMVAEHMKGPFFLTQALLPLLADGGRVLNTSSGLARFSFPGYAAYGAAKAGAEGITRYMARELGPRGISVNIIAPGAIETDFGGGITRDDAAFNAQIASITAMGRAGLPDDVGAAAASILTSDGNWVTGQRIEVSGGTLI
jgi:NAD(P)-dependent dehydrogenase (short-subunit alcohol dehydrogenase family)